MRIPSHIITILFFSWFLSCSDSDDNPIAGCGFDDPAQQLPWLKEAIDRMVENTSPDVKYCYVVQGTYKNRTVFRIEDCNPLVDKVVFTLNCDGNRIDSDQDFVSLSDLNNPTIIWKPRDFACQVNF